MKKGRFIYKGIVIETIGNNAVLIKDEDGKIKKRSLRDVKKIFNETSVWEGDVKYSNKFTLTFYHF